MTRRTAFFFDELCLWHAAGPHALTLPVGGWVQPPAAAGHAESPETKRRLKSLLDVSGLTAHLQLRSAPPASDEDLLRVHPAHYLERFKALSDAGGGSLGQDAPIGPGSYEIARLSAGLAIAALDAVLAGEADNAYCCRGRQVITACRTRRWASVSSPTSPWPSRRPRRATASSGSRCWTGTCTTVTAPRRSTTGATTC